MTTHTQPATINAMIIAEREIQLDVLNCDVIHARSKYERASLLNHKEALALFTEYAALDQRRHETALQLRSDRIKYMIALETEIQRLTREAM
jgi:hypothetical protein